MDNLTALVLAGGKGTRLASLYPGVPKPLVPVSGQPFLHWLVLWLKEQGLKDFVFSTGYLGDAIEAWLAATPLSKDARVRVQREPAPLGTGGGAISCLPLCQERVLILNGDSLTLAPLAPFFDLLSDPAIGGAIVGSFVEDASRYASLAVDKDNILTDYVEKKAGRGLISAGIYLFRRTALESFPADVSLSMEYDIIPALLRRGQRLKIHPVPLGTPFIDIGTPETIAQATDFIQKNFRGAA
jgi:D-glycero-alpha-D-manno-heptose 1-phosphate guanylyltransferase